MRNSLFALLLMLPGVSFGWSGISAFLGQGDSDWLFSDTTQSADVGFYGLQIEDRTQSDLRIGASAGQFELRLLPAPNALAERYSGKFLSLYLRLPSALNESLTLQTLVRYQYHLGDQSLQPTQQISWNEITLELAVSLQVGRLALRPYVYLQRIDGDITSSTQTRLFKLADNAGSGLMLDYYVEAGAYVRLRASGGSRRSAGISFVREY